MTGKCAPVLIACLIAVYCSACGRSAQTLVYPDFNPYAISKIVFSDGENHHIELKRVTCKQWTVTEKGRVFLADLTAIQSFVNMISVMEKLPAETKPKPGSPEKCKSTNVRIHANGIYSFNVGKTGANYQSSYIQLDKAKKCVRVKPFFNCVVNMPLQKWIKKSVFDTDPDTVREILIRHNDSVLLHVSRDKCVTDWTDRLRPGAAIPNDKVGELYGVLSKIRIHNATAANAGEMGKSDPPLLEIQVRCADNCLSVFKLGGRKNSSFYFASRSDEETGTLLFSSMWVEKLERIITDTTGAECLILQPK